ncbi:MAG: succinate dehydrogenase, hydrophobic membrane anchor protein [Candidatus Krumholzibacteria bacterium]|nr:succinate dehydrogenase, hydrophobic membrane anchor protein [Candidatus Krumholzibacteria bacterium]
MKYRENVKSGGALPWFFQRVTGVYLAVVLFLHVIMLHFALKEELSFAAIKYRVATPMWKTINISFLVVALFHGLYGLWIVLDDYINKDWARVLLFGVIAVVALIFFILGVLTILPFQAGG